MDEKRREDIQKYIDSLANTDAYNEDSYVIRLENFEGPIDLLWFLIRRSKIDISEIFVSQITDQYLKAMDQVERLDMEKACEFLQVAACLIEIKSKKMLPSPPIVELPDDEDPEKILMRKLLEYKEKYYPLYKDASKKMKDYENTDSFYRAPDSSVGKPRFILADMNMDGLVKALQKMFFKIEQKAKENQVKTIERDRFTVEERTEQLKEIFTTSPRLLFEDLIEEDYSKIEIITTFQAILELLKAQFLHVIQDGPFADIIIEKMAEEDKDEENRESANDNQQQKEQTVND